MTLNGTQVYKEGSLTHEVFLMCWHMSGCPGCAAKTVMEIHRMVLKLGAPVHTLN